MPAGRPEHHRTFPGAFGAFDADPWALAAAMLAVDE